MSFEDDTFTTEGGRYTWSYSQFEDRDDQPESEDSFWSSYGSEDSFWSSYLTDIDSCQTNPDVRYRAAKKISNLKYSYQIRNKLVKLLFEDGLNYLISVYAAEENLPEEYLKIVKNDDCLDIILKSFFKNTCKIELSKSLTSDIETIIDKVHKNEDMDIVYNRVSEIQRIIHDTVDCAYGFGTQFNLPTILVKKILSATRLHLNIWDIKYQHATDLLKIISSSRIASTNEISSPTSLKLAPGKTYFPHWRVRHLLSLADFSRPELAAKINALMNLDESCSLATFREYALTVYSAIPPD